MAAKELDTNDFDLATFNRDSNLKKESNRQITEIDSLLYQSGKMNQSALLNLEEAVETKVATYHTLVKKKPTTIFR